MNEGEVKRGKVCIVTPGYISSTPRVVKEADALAEAGYSVRVVCTQGDIERARSDDAMTLAGKQWRASILGWSRKRSNERVLYWKSTLRYQTARRIPASLWSFLKLVESGEGRTYKELAALASAVQADLFIGHYPVGLAAAAHAASVWKARVGYDAEDLHSAEQPDTPEGRLRTRRIEVIERKYIQQCVHLTAASTGIAEALHKRYGSAAPLVLHNVFPWKDRSNLDRQIKDRKGPELSLYWFSQTIGLDRGIQDVIRAAGCISRPIQIHLRGSVTDSVRSAILGLAESQVAQRIYFHKPVPPGDLLSRAAEHDVGLAVEQPVNASRMLSVTNKLFLYLLAGLAIAATDVPGQRKVMDSCRSAGALYTPGDYLALAALLEQWVRRPDELAACKHAAVEASQSQWNWELESRRLVETVDELLSGKNRLFEPVAALV
jgi:glycosyltransferase involved in cell wall biosynthesis